MRALALFVIINGLIILGGAGVPRAQNAPTGRYTPGPVPFGSAYRPPPAAASLPARSGGTWPNCHPGCVNTTNAPPPPDMPKELVDTWMLGDPNEPIIGDPQHGWWVPGCSGGQYNDATHQLESGCGRPWGHGWVQPPGWKPPRPPRMGTVNSKPTLP